MMGHKICFSGDLWTIIPKLSLLPFLIGALLCCGNIRDIAELQIQEGIEDNSKIIFLISQ